MEKYPTTERSDPSQSLPEPVVLTQEEARQIAGGLALVVSGITGHGCTTCGLGGRFLTAE